MMYEFSRDFKWGISQSGFQFEMGDAYHRFIDANSDWWYWARDPHNIFLKLVSGDLPEDGINYLELYRVDHENARWLGLNAYRIGLEWSRIFPYPTVFIEVDVKRDGEGFVKDVKITKETLEKLDQVANHDAITIYREIISDLRKRGFKVVVNLYHFTLPYWIHNPIRSRASGLKKGPLGLLEEYFPIEFAKFAAYTAYKLGDIVDVWSTITEPMVPIELGYMAPYAGFPPGVNRPDVVARAFANTVIAHGLAYRAIKRFDAVKADLDSKEPAEVGIIHNFIPAHPISESESSAAENYNYFHNYMLLEAVVRGKLDSDLDMKSITKPAVLGDTVDWLGVNYYTRIVVKKKGGVQYPILDFEAIPGYGYACVPYSTSKIGRWCDGMGWEMFPEGLIEALTMASKYSSTLYITENGTSDLRDVNRATYIVSHVYAMLRAIEQGINLKGYFHWSINDNYEWPQGFKQKFGLFEVDLITKERRPRPSARVFKEITTKNAISGDILKFMVFSEKSPGEML